MSRHGGAEVGPQSTDETSAWTPIGYVVRPHGIKGELRLHLDLPWASLQGDVTELCLTPRGGGIATRVAARTRSVHNGVLVTLAGIDTPETAAVWRGASVSVQSCHIPACEEGEFYVTELKGAQVFDETGTCLGVMRDVVDNAGQALGIIAGSDGAERLLPLVPQTIRAFDRAACRLDVRVPPGLWDA